MSHVQLALNVSDLPAAVDFYSKLLRAEPSKRRPGYANFAVADPPLKLVLIEGGGQPGTLNHLGIEVDSADQVREAKRRLSEEGLETVGEESVACCYALQDKLWVDDPDGSPWEVYTVLADSDVPPGDELRSTPGDTPACCGQPSDSPNQASSASRC